MAHTNATENYGLPQWIGTDKPTFLGDFNSAFGTIDTQMKANSDAATNAVSTANTADSNATNALANANTALSTANSAASTANDATVIANQAKTQSTTAAADAASALTASAANTITNLAPAYDSTRTYSVGELVTYVDANNSGKLYKCIVAVATPMEFNINYWDDVTTSEIYNRTATQVYDKEFAANSVSFASMMTDIYNNITINPSKEYLMVWSGNITRTIHQRFNSATEIDFTDVELSLTSYSLLEFRVNSNGAFFVCETSASGSTFTNNSAVVPTIAVRFTIYELSTI